MERSLAQTVELRCVSCAQPFAAELWLIVDAAERPDLTAQIDSGSMHVAQCPHCGTPHPVDAPLLFHDGAAQALIFAAQQHGAPEEAHSIARQLGQFLISRIPLAERQPYLASAQIVVGEEALRRARLSQPAPEDELSIALRALMEARAAEDIRAVAAAHPVLETTTALEQLDEYVRRLRQDRHLETAEALAERLTLLRAAQPHPTVDLIQALLDADSPEQRQRILHDRAQDLTDDVPDVLEALAEQAQRRQLDAIARDMRVIRGEVLTSLGREHRTQNTEPGTGNSKR
ncbi:MAG TPA: CpXC domain-containing protein [Herpetosiphonaceae bacterium]